MSSQDRHILIIDSNTDNLSRLERIISEEGFRVTATKDGMQGMVKFYQDRPDLVVIDYGDGPSRLDTCREIKALASETFVPIIIISPYLQEADINRCVEAGADDIVFRPFSTAIFRSKIHSLFRIAGIYSKLYTLTAERQNDEELAEGLFSEVVEKGNIAGEYIKIFKRSAETFSGDVQLTALCPNGDINVLLGDFTGHGLSSAIGAIPLSDTFRAMTDKGYTSIEIIKQINRKMFLLLPTHMFLALQMVTLSVAEGVAYIWNAGMEDVFIFDASNGELKERVSSFHPPLGITNYLIGDMKPRLVPLGQNDRIIMYSDGIVEARNRAGDFFGEDRLIDASRQGFTHGDVQGHIIAALEVFCEDLQQDDDISLVDINCDVSCYESLGAIKERDRDIRSFDSDRESATDFWAWQMSIGGDKLARVNPIPLIINQIQEIEGPSEHWHELFTVLTELYINALDHGVLGLSSELKDSPEGFALYFTEKEKRLRNIGSGYVKIKLEHYSCGNGGSLAITLIDSGSGFEFSPWIEQETVGDLSKNHFSGRGIKLVSDLCQSLSYRENGSVVEAVYQWSGEGQVN